MRGLEEIWKEVMALPDEIDDVSVKEASAIIGEIYGWFYYQYYLRVQSMLIEEGKTTLLVSKQRILDYFHEIRNMDWEKFIDSLKLAYPALFVPFDLKKEE